MPSLKTMSLKYNELFDFARALEGKKRGTPKNEGVSLDVYENKCRKILHFGPKKMCIKSKDL